MTTAAFDMDGVLADWDAGFREYMRIHTPTIPIIEYAQRVNFYAVQDYPEEHREALKRLAYLPGFYRSLPPVPGSLEVVKRLAGHMDVILLTAPMSHHPTCAQEKIEWVVEHLGPEWQDRVFIAKDKTRVRADYLIDDKPGITGVRVPEWEHLLMDAPYNATYDEVRRVTWENMEETIASEQRKFPRSQDVDCLVKVNGKVLPKMYRYNGMAWFRADGAYGSKSKTAPGRIDRVDEWKDVSSATKYLGKMMLPTPSLARLWRAY